MILQKISNRHKSDTTISL